jgi:hypothetical protein
MSSITHTHASAAQRLPARTEKANPARGKIKRVLPVVLAIAWVLALPAAQALASTEVPFRAQLTQAATFAACPTGTPTSVVCVAQTGTGTATLLGRMTKESLVVLTFVSPTCVTFIEYTTFSAANGDTITAVQNGTGCFTSPTTAVGNATYTVTGGTGRFRGAKGSGTATTTLTAVEPGVLVGPATYDGVLSSPGSLK